MVSLEPSSKLSALHEHFKDSLEKLQLKENRREWLFVLLIIAICFLLFQIQYPDQSVKAAEALVKKQLDISDLLLNSQIVRSVLWIFLAVIIHAYYQTDLFIERYYPYIHKIEEKLQDLLGDNEVFCRESCHYLKQYPAFSEWTWMFYKIIVPVFLVVVLAIQIIQEFIGVGFSTHFCFDLCAYVLSTLSIALYVWAIHNESMVKFASNYLPWIRNQSHAP